MLGGFVGLAMEGYATASPHPTATAPKRPPSAAAAAGVDTRVPLRAPAAGDALAAPSAVLDVQTHRLSTISPA